MDSATRDESRILHAWSAAVLSGLISAGLTLLYISGVLPVPGVDAWAFVDCGLLFALAFGVAKQSRVCAILLVLYAIVNEVYMVSLLSRPSPLRLIFLGFYVRGMIGTFRVHRHQTPPPLQTNEPPEAEPANESELPQQSPQTWQDGVWFARAPKLPMVLLAAVLIFPPDHRGGFGCVFDQVHVDGTRLLLLMVLAFIVAPAIAAAWSFLCGITKRGWFVAALVTVAAGALTAAGVAVFNMNRLEAELTAAHVNLEEAKWKEFPTVATLDALVALYGSDPRWWEKFRSLKDYQERRNAAPVVPVADSSTRQEAAVPVRKAIPVSPKKRAGLFDDLIPNGQRDPAPQPARRDIFDEVADSRSEKR